MEYDFGVLEAFAKGGAAAAVLLIVVGFIVLSLRSRDGVKREWIIYGALSIPAAWFASFPLSNRDYPVTWFLMFMLMYGGGLGIGMMLSVLGRRPIR